MATNFNKAELAVIFPSLNEEGFEITSPYDKTYNCIAWAANENHRWWDVQEEYYWPENVEKSTHERALIAAYEAIGYVKSDDGSEETGYEKVALYSKGGYWQHAARLLPGGKWTSKLGESNDIEHAQNGLIDSCYGNIFSYMKRKIN